MKPTRDARKWQPLRDVVDPRASTPWCNLWWVCPWVEEHYAGPGWRITVDPETGLAWTFSVE